LLQQGLETQTAANQGERAPTPAELAAYFPDLEIIELLGRGGMGVVYKARQKRLDRLVALKILSPKIGRDPAFAERFAREARAMAMLNHPHVVAVYDSGQAISPRPLAGEGPGARATTSPLPFAGEGAGVRGPDVESPLYYFLMEFVDGVSLRRLLDTARLSPREALAIVPQICDGLQYAHDMGVVHRDIKPENILLDKQGRVKIADFGIAKLVGRDASDLALTGAGEVMGTPHYMAPEQTEHPREVDHRADIYSLGVVFYQMLTGELPLGRFAAPSQKVQIDVRLDEIVLRALEKEPARRYQQASQVKTEVESIVTTPRVSGEVAGQAPAPNSPSMVSKCYVSTPEHLRSLRGRFLWIYKGKGELRLDNQLLSFHSDWPAIVIPLSSIRNIAQGDYPYWAKPVPIQYIEVTYADHGVERKVLFTPTPGATLFPAEVNRLGEQWLSTLQEAIRARTGLTLPVERCWLAQDKLSTAKMLLISATTLAAMTTLFYSILELVSERRLLNANELLFGPVFAIVSTAVTFLALWERRRRAIASGNLDALSARRRRATGSASASRPDDAIQSSGKASGAPANHAAIAEARQQVRGPAIGLLVTGILNWVVVLPIVSLLSFTMAAKRDGPGGLMVLLPISLMILSSVMIFAALKMKRLQAYGLAIAASILAIIISPGNVVGLPIGIWALVVLSQREVRAGFRHTRTRGTGSASVSPPDDLQTCDAPLPNAGSASGKAVVAAGTGAQVAAPQLSQIAVVGAAWALLFFALMPMSAAPSDVRVFSMFTLLPLGLLAPFGTTTMGIIGLGQIRRSVGRLYGVGLALFDALFFPLLALDTLLGCILVIFAREAAASFTVDKTWLRENLFYSIPMVVVWLLATVAASAGVDYVIVRRAWRAAHRPAPGGSERPNLGKIAGLIAAACVIMVLCPACGFLILVHWNHSDARQEHSEMRLAKRDEAAAAPSSPGIDRVLVAGGKATIEGQASTRSKLVFRVGAGFESCGFRKATRFTAVLWSPWLGRGLDAAVTAADGESVLTLGNGTFGPMGSQPGHIVFREGAIKPEADGSFIVADFRPQSGAAVPLSVRLETEDGTPPAALQKIKSFDITAKPITKDGVTMERSDWRIDTQADRTVRLFEVAEPGVDDCTLFYRAMLKTENLAGRAYLEMWCRMPSGGEYFSKGLMNPVSGTTDWATCETPFFLKKGERPDLVKLNVVVEGHGTLWIKNVELLKGPLPAPQAHMAADASRGPTAGGDAGEFARQGWELWRKGQMNEAVAKFHDAVKLAPDDANAWNGLGWASFNSGRLPAAEKAFQTVVTLSPEHPAGLNGLGQLYLLQRKYAKAEKYLLQAAPQAPAAWWGLTRLYLLQGKFDQAEKWAQKVVDSGQADDGARELLQAAKERRLSDSLRRMIEPSPAKTELPPLPKLPPPPRPATPAHVGSEKNTPSNLGGTP
jgi:serine/threonine protein kinase